MKSYGENKNIHGPGWEFDLFEKLREAYENTCQRWNTFKEAIESIAWDDSFEADGEIYFVKGGFTLTVENLNPFAQAWKPTVWFSDNGMIEF